MTRVDKFGESAAKLNASLIFGTADDPLKIEFRDAAKSRVKLFNSRSLDL